MRFAQILSRLKRLSRREKAFIVIAVVLAVAHDAIYKITSRATGLVLGAAIGLFNLLVVLLTAGVLLWFAYFFFYKVLLRPILRKRRMERSRMDRLIREAALGDSEEKD